MAYGLRSFADTLDQILHPDKHHKTWVLGHDHRPQVQSLYDNVTFLQDFLDKSSPQIQERISSVEDQIMEVAQKAADTLETNITDQILLNPEDQSFTIYPSDMGEVIRAFEDAQQEVIKIKDESQPSDHILPPAVSPTRYPDSKNILVGVEEDLNQLRCWLTSTVAELDIISIVGMGGIGKTTLARILYDEYSSTKSYFDRCAWVTVSQSYDPQLILEKILVCVSKKPLKEMSQKERSDLVTTLYRKLVGTRYLIVLDDIWSCKAWDEVQKAFAKDNLGSRVIFTTRENSLVDHVKSNSHEMCLINEDNSWELLRRKVFSEESCPPELEEVGKRIALKCGGLPLALQVIGGLLAHSQRTEDFWEYVAHNVSTLIATTNDQFAGIFSWSFAHLPHYLKPCFLYMGAFSEDYEIPPSRIIELLVAEGFLYPLPDKSLEETAKIHLNALVDRSLVIVRTRRWNGKAKSYGIHDLLRDLCLKEAQKKKFLYVKKSTTDILQEAILGARRVCAYPTKNDAESYYGSLKLTPFARSFLLGGYDKSNEFVSHLCSKAPLLRVLDVYQSPGPGCDFQDVFLHLVNLRYLAIDNSYLSAARGISVLKNLQTLKVNSLESLGILEHLPQLRHLYFNHTKDEITTILSEISPHENLQCLSSVPFSDLTYLLEKLPNLRKLVVNADDEVYDSVVDLTCFQKLESLSFRSSYFDLTVPLSLKRLKFIYYKFSLTLLSKISILPVLQVLKLYGCEFENDKWEPSEGGYCQLHYLEIAESKLGNWIVTESSFPVLRHLVLRTCHHLIEIPNEIGGIETLETIELNECKATVFHSARMIHEEQLEFGNIIQLRLGHTFEDIDNEQAVTKLKSFERNVEDYELTISRGAFMSTKSIFPHSLKKLTLRHCKVNQPALNAMGGLLELQVLKLEICDFIEPIWQPSEGQFCKLQHLEIKSDYNLCEWLATETNFPVLKHLVLQKSLCLIQIPIGIGRIATLDMIEVEECMPSLVESARMILKEQRKLGNTLLQLRLDGALVEEKEE